MNSLPVTAEELDLSITEYSQRLSACSTPISDLKAVLIQAVYPTDRSEALVRVTLSRIRAGVNDLHQLLQLNQPKSLFSDDMPVTDRLDQFAATERVYNLRLDNFTGVFASTYRAHISNNEPLCVGYGHLMQHLRCLKAARDNYLNQFHNFRRNLLAQS